MRPFFAVVGPLAVIAGIFCLATWIYHPGISPEQCRRLVIAEFDRGEIPSLERLDAELLACGQ